MIINCQISNLILKNKEILNKIEILLLDRSFLMISRFIFAIILIA